MEFIYFICSGILILATVLPIINHPHWIFRVCDFGKVQIFYFQLILVSLGFLQFNFSHQWFLLSQTILFLLAIYNASKLISYVPLINQKRSIQTNTLKGKVCIITVNVYQFNKEYDRLISLIRKYKPDIFFTVETNKSWEEALSVLEKEYPESYKIPLENTYGMHFYSKLKIEKVKVHHFVAEDIPSLEVDLKTDEGIPFTVFGVHPPPPSPTEEDTSEERDGELLSIAKQVLNSTKTFIVIGDFNDVSWSKSSIMFKKISQLIDARKGRGLLSTFHANYKLLRFPLDLVYHSPAVYIREIKVLEPIGSDHFPIFCDFHILNSAETNKVDSVDPELKKRAKTKINKGKEYSSDRDKIATE